MDIVGKNLQELEEFMLANGQSKFRAKQVYNWVYLKSVPSYDDMTDLPLATRELLKEKTNLCSISIKDKQVSKDGTMKFLFELKDGHFIETVLMNHVYGNSLCVTTQVGCNMGCVFCASGMYKKVRNLETSEIVLQLMTVQKLIGKKITHVVIMGIGEPFDNYDNVMKFMKIINQPKGLEIGARHISVSTCGLVPKINEFSNEPMQSNLAISLHAPTNEVRDQIMPINKAYPLEVLIPALKDYINKTNRRVTLEYILLKDLNDTVECANKLASLIRGMNVYVNLIPYNEVKEKPYKRSTANQMKAFFDALKKRGINVTLRQEQGHDIDAACGQLRSKKMNNK